MSREHWKRVYLFISFDLNVLVVVAVAAGFLGVVVFIIVIYLLLTSLCR